jgi:prophage maintenance system killer protein
MLGMTTFLLENKISIDARDNELYGLIIRISTGKLNFEELVDWLKNNTTKL